MKSSSTRKLVARRTRTGGAGGQSRTWTRRLHFYLGLYLLLFIWLFAVSGLFLNHPEWELTHGFWEEREESSTERVFAPPRSAGDLAIAQELMREFGVVGEINEIRRDPADDRFGFQVVRPGRIFDVDASFGTGRATVKEIDLNAWGVLDALHKFTGVKMDDPSRERDWLLTRVWSIAMDAVALGLMVLVFSGLYLWYRLEKKRLLGVAVLGMGTISCGLFVLGVVHVF